MTGRMTAAGLWHEFDPTHYVGSLDTTEMGSGQNHFVNNVVAGALSKEYVYAEGLPPEGIADAEQYHAAQHARAEAEEPVQAPEAVAEVETPEAVVEEPSEAPAAKAPSTRKRTASRK